MTTITQLEDLEVWKEAKVLAKMIYSLAEHLPKPEEYNLKKTFKRKCPRVTS